MGINIWHHSYKNGEPSWCNIAFLAASYFKKRTIYDLELSIIRKPKSYQMQVGCGNNIFGCTVPEYFTAKAYHAGIIGCEGMCRFYDLRI